MTDDLRAVATELLRKLDEAPECVRFFYGDETLILVHRLRALLARPVECGCDTCGDPHPPSWARMQELVNENNALSAEIEKLRGYLDQHRANGHILSPVDEPQQDWVAGSVCDRGLVPSGVTPVHVESCPNYDKPHWCDPPSIVPSASSPTTERVEQLKDRDVLVNRLAEGIDALVQVYKDRGGLQRIRAFITEELGR